MKSIINISIFMLLVFTLNAQITTFKIDKSIVQNVILINYMPWEVMMNKDGEILAKLKYLPDYLKGYDLNWEKDTNYEPPIPVKEQVQNTVRSDIQNNFVNSTKNSEIFFHVGSALLKSKQIQQLNELAQKLNSNPSMVVRLFGFTHEPETRYSILGKRRIDAVIAYLKIKGVDIDRQIIRGSNVSGENNKIVFAFE